MRNITNCLYFYDVRDESIKTAQTVNMTIAPLLQLLRKLHLQSHESKNKFVLLKVEDKRFGTAQKKHAIYHFREVIFTSPP